MLQVHSFQLLLLNRSVYVSKSRLCYIAELVNHSNRNPILCSQRCSPSLYRMQVEQRDKITEMSLLGLYNNEESLRQVALQNYGSEIILSTR